MRNLVLYGVDVETTNLDYTKGDIIEISLLRTTDLAQKTWYLKPLCPENIEDKALEINGANKEDLLWNTEAGRNKYKHPEDVLPEIENFINDDGVKIYDRVLFGHNVQFDETWLKSTWKRQECMDSYPFSEYGMLIDTKGLALFFDWVANTHNEKYNLSACIKKYGLELRKAHTATDDVLMAFDLLKTFASKLKQ